jgi:methylenetetrahydrofolate reductase (NADPH)
MSQQTNSLPIERLAECPKTMVNGPCGGVSADGRCEVGQGKLCVWYEALDGRAPDADPTLRRPADWRASWASAFDADQLEPLPPIEALPDRESKPLLGGGRLERTLRAGTFAITCELNPPDSASADALVARARTLAPYVHAAHVTDNALASPHMAAWAVAALVQAAGIEPIPHMACRDRNRIALQADLLGLHAVGVRTVLAVTGDHPGIGDHAGAKAVFDLDALGWLAGARRLRDHGRFIEGERSLTERPALFLGACAGATAPPFEQRPYRLYKKIAAGADFVVTQLIFDLDLLRGFLARVRDLGLERKVYLFVGVGALPSAAAAEAIARETPGVVIPESIIRRLAGVPLARQRDEGAAICAEMIQALREMPDVSGIDLMDLDPHGWHPTIEILERAGMGRAAES